MAFVLVNVNFFFFYFLFPALTGIDYALGAGYVALAVIGIVAILACLTSGMES